MDLGEALRKLKGAHRNIDLNLFEEIACYETEGRFKNNGFAKLVHSGHYLYTTTKKHKKDKKHKKEKKHKVHDHKSSSSSSSSSSSDYEFHADKSAHVGQMRIGFHHDVCGTATVMG